MSSVNVDPAARPLHRHSQFERHVRALLIEVQVCERNEASHAAPSIAQVLVGLLKVPGGGHRASCPSTTSVALQQRNRGLSVYA